MAGGLVLPYSGGVGPASSGGCPCDGSCGCIDDSTAFAIQNGNDGGSAILGVGAQSISVSAGQSGYGVVGIGGVSNEGDTLVAGDGMEASGGSSADSAFSGSRAGAGISAYGGTAMGSTNIPGVGIYAQGGPISGSDTPVGPAGQFVGDVEITGNLSKSGGSFKIDDPIDPANKYLYHSFVESPDMMNIYNGNVTTNGSGEAVVTMPSYFESLNRDFRYQLTVLGQFAQAIVGSEIAGNTFVIKTDKPGVKVSWQVTGVRQDAWANAHRIPNEEDKPAAVRGKYLHPELFGHAGELAIQERRHPLRATGTPSRGAALR